MAKEGWPFIIFSAALAVAAWAAYGKDRSLWLKYLAWSLTGLTIFVGYFFRDPDRFPPTDPKAVVSPGDGKVVAIVTQDDDNVGAESWRVSVFLSVFDVHVNRIPIGGDVRQVHYIPGKFLAAFNDKASLDNEQTYITIETPFGMVAFKQIAGVVARRIVCKLTPGQKVNTGDRMGLIRFGSRVDVIMPASATVSVQVGDRVVAGETILGVLE